MFFALKLKGSAAKRVCYGCQPKALETILDEFSSVHTAKVAKKKIV
jgi:hypothetical protein